ncbi:hypothetical protein MKW94_022620 [Papaver nudicaule]|uniref:SUN domain-containing protein n=1 Tax=Papaver nudicaule TaxID=74823 RepID=A0AA41VAJ2_PAPNU|nr:hypothetical protein [Papaver nudicaule]
MRRTVVTEKKSSNFESVADGGGGGAGGGGVVVSEKITNVGGGRDLSHTIRGEISLDRETTNVKKSQVMNSTISPLPRRKKIVSKPLWKRILSIAIKNLLLLLVILGFTKMIYNLSAKSGANGIVSSEIEGRIAEVESFLKTTTKMMQVQVEVMDRKIESEVSGLRREIVKKVDEKSVKYESELKKLGDKADELGKSFEELKGNGILTKEDLDRFLEDVKKSNGDGSDKEWRLDDIRSFAKEIVDREIEIHASDGLGMVDYALASGGGMVLDHSERFQVTKGPGWLPFKKQYGVDQDAQRVLEPSFGEPGKCFPLRGSQGYIVIMLRTGIIPEAVTVEHVSKSVAYDRSSAPKDCRVSGWYQKVETITGGGAGVSRLGEKKMFRLAEFVYDLDRSNAQTFNVESGEKRIINMVRFDFASNHGASHTCIYRLRVHGYEPDSVAISEFEL